MSIGRIIATLIGCLILGVIAGLVTRNIIVAITFPFLLVGFLLMWRNLQQNPPEDVEKQDSQKENNPRPKVETKQEVNQPQAQKTQPQQRPTQPPVSTNYPPTPPEL
jgi:hypothetical protein